MKASPLWPLICFPGISAFTSPSLTRHRRTTSLGLYNSVEEAIAEAQSKNLGFSLRLSVFVLENDLYFLRIGMNYSYLTVSLA